MQSLSAKAAALSALTLVAGCVSFPTGPSVMALPGAGKTFDQFRVDDAQCRQYALGQVGGTTPGQAATDAGVGTAMLGTAIGAVAGAAIGGRSGAAVGAGTGLLIGSMAGTGAAQASSYQIQRRYDNAYLQCMYANGENVPVPGTLASPGRQPPPPPQPAPLNSYPPPPPGSPPPPPRY
jgi:hypothetical protein